MQEASEMTTFLLESETGPSQSQFQIPAHPGCRERSLVLNFLQVQLLSELICDQLAICNSEKMGEC